MTPLPAGEPKPGTFEAHLAALERVVADLEGDALSLEGSIERYKEGVGHLASCRRILDAAEQRLAELVAAPDGSVSERPLTVGPEGLVDAEPSASSTPPKSRVSRRPAASPDESLPF